MAASVLSPKGVPAHRMPPEPLTFNDVGRGPYPYVPFEYLTYLYHQPAIFVRNVNIVNIRDVDLA